MYIQKQQLPFHFFYFTAAVLLLLLLIQKRSDRYCIFIAAPRADADASNSSSKRDCVVYMSRHGSLNDDYTYCVE